MATRTAGEEGGLTPRRLRAAQRSFTLFAFLNMISFQLLTGNVIALYALRLEAGEPLIGVLYSFMPLAYLLPLLGRAVVRRMGTVRTMAVFWILRQLLMVPLLFAPLAAARGRPEIGIWLIVISVVGFNLARGIAMTSFNAVVGAITAPAERGSFLARVQLVSHLGAIAAGLAMGLLLQQRSPLFLFTLVLSLGVVTGLLAARELFRLPEPAALAPRGSFGPALRDAFRRRGFPRFLVVLALNSFVTAMALPFLLVYVKRVHGLGDNTAILLAAVGSVGAIVMALVSSFVIDRVGASPLLPLFNIVVTVTMLLVVAAPPLAGPGAAWIYLGAIFFFATFAAFGTENTHSVYYLSLIRAEERLNLGIFDLVVIRPGRDAGVARRRRGAGPPGLAAGSGNGRRVPHLLRRHGGGLYRHPAAHHAAGPAGRRLISQRAGHLRVAPATAGAGAAPPAQGQPHPGSGRVPDPAPRRGALRPGGAGPAAGAALAALHGALGGAGRAVGGAVERRRRGRR